MTEDDRTDFRIKGATPLITVEDVDACLPFWLEGLGFELLGTVPHEDTTGFAMLRHGDVQLMYQSRASVQADLEASGAPAGLADEMGASHVDALHRGRGPRPDQRARGRR